MNRHDLVWLKSKSSGQPCCAGYQVKSWLSAVRLCLSVSLSFARLVRPCLAILFTRCGSALRSLPALHWFFLNTSCLGSLLVTHLHCMPRGERGGKKNARSKYLSREVYEGRHNPVTAPTSEAGINRRQRVREEVDRQREPVVTTEVRAVPKRGSGSGGVNLQAAPVTPPKAPAAASSSQGGYPVVDPVGGSLASSSSAPVSVPVANPIVEPKPKLRLPRKRDLGEVVEPKAEARSVVAASTPKQKAVSPVVAKDKSSSEASSSSRRLSEPVVDLSGSNPHVERTSAPSVPAAIQEYRISIDFNQVLNIQQHGDRECAGIHPYNVQLLKSFLERNQGRGFRLAVTSYIGRTGEHSQERRDQLIRTVREFNRDQVGEENKLGVRVVESRHKGQLLNPNGVHVHIDDKIICLNSCADSIRTFWVSNPRFPHRRHQSVNSLEQALRIIEDGRIETSVQSRPFGSIWLIP